MGFVMKAVAGRADGTRVKTLVETLLGVFIFSIFSTILECLQEQKNRLLLSAFWKRSTMNYKNSRIYLVDTAMISINESPVRVFPQLNLLVPWSLFRVSK